MMRVGWRWVVVVGVMGAARPAWAGMPMVTLTEVARARFQSISFFLLVLLLSGAAVMGMWNGLRKDFPWLPQLSYGRAMGVVGLWGMLFVLVLTMISGARELMTPGAWEKVGATYRVSGRTEEEERKEKLLALKAALFDYSRRHAGQFPGDDWDTVIARSVWETPDASRARYVYVAPAGLTVTGATPLAYEPSVFPSPRFVLTHDGDVRKMGDHEIAAVIPGGAR